MRRAVFAVGALGLLAACAPHSAADWEKQVQARSEIVQEGGTTPLEARLSQRAAESMAVQEVPFTTDPKAWNDLKAAASRYRNQYTFRLSILPKASAKADPANPLALDIENNGGMWRDHSRNLHRLMFEMGPFIRLRMADGTEVEPNLVEFQRSFGMGRERSFMLVFPSTHENKPIRPPFEVRVKEFGQGMGTLVFPVKSLQAPMGDWRLKRMWKADAEAARRASESQ